FPSGEVITLEFLITPLDPGLSAVLGYGFLFNYNPLVDWKKSQLTFPPGFRTSASPDEPLAPPDAPPVPLDAPPGPLVNPSGSPSDQSPTAPYISFVAPAAFTLISRMKGVVTGVLHVSIPDTTRARAAHTEPDLSAEDLAHLPTDYHDFADVFSAT